MVQHTMWAIPHFYPTIRRDRDCDHAPNVTIDIIVIGIASYRVNNWNAFVDETLNVSIN